MALFDIETANVAPLLTFDKSGVGMINSVTMHPTLPVVITAHQDRHIRFWDINTGIDFGFDCQCLISDMLVFFQANVCTPWWLIWTR